MVKWSTLSLGNNVAERGASTTKNNCDESQTVESQTNNCHSEFLLLQLFCLNFEFEVHS